MSDSLDDICAVCRHIRAFHIEYGTKDVPRPCWLWMPQLKAHCECEEFTPIEDTLFDEANANDL